MRRRFDGRSGPRALLQRLVAPALAVAFLIDCAPARTHQHQALDPALDEFVRRADAYAELHRRIEAEGPTLEPTEDPGELAARKEALAQRIHDARTGAKQGDVFTKNAAEPLRKIVRSHERGSVEPKQPPSEQPATRPRLNTRYPEAEPLPTMPPALLAALPQLPKEIQYRLIGPDLTLLDSETRIVVDVLPNARQ